MIEVEIKLPVSDNDLIEKRLVLAGFQKKKVVKEEDFYFNSELHDFRKRDEALRIRKVTDMELGADKAVVTFKGPKLDQISMTRVELETGIEDMETMRRIFRALGYDQEYPVIKKRQYFMKDHITACLDEVDDLGIFLELEVLVEDELDREKGLAKLERILVTLGYSLADTTRTSYLSMLMRKWENR